MWSGVTFDAGEIINQAVPLINLFMPMIYVLGGITVFALVMLVIVVIVRKAAG